MQGDEGGGRHLRVSETVLHLLLFLPFPLHILNMLLKNTSNCYGFMDLLTSLMSPKPEIISLVFFFFFYNIGPSRILASFGANSSLEIMGIQISHQHVVHFLMSDPFPPKKLGDNGVLVTFLGQWTECFCASFYSLGHAPVLPLPLAPTSHFSLA